MPKQMKEETPTRYEQPGVKSNLGYLTKDGRERPDPTPMAPPIGWKPSEPLHKRIREMIISERLAQEAAAAGDETFEEADDFDVGDDYDPTAPYEEQFDPVGYEPGAMMQAVKEHNEAVKAAQERQRQDIEAGLSARQRGTVAKQATSESEPPPSPATQGRKAEGGGTQGVHPETPPAAPTPEQPRRSPFWPRK